MHSFSLFDRKNGKTIVEKVYGESGIRFLYHSKVGRILEEKFLSHSWFSKLYGTYQDTPFSTRAIPSFIQAFEIPMEEYEDRSYLSFNDFFIRKFKPGKRVFSPDPQHFCAPAEGRYLFFPKLLDDTPLPIKGATLNVTHLLGKSNSFDLSRFHGGPALIARLCPVDYHRFHFPDEGQIQSQYLIPGPLHSVNPIALGIHGDLLFRNERMVTLLETRHFGHLAYIEVGAICVGKIVQTHKKQHPFHRGEEKGYFLFGGSTVIVVGEPGRIVFDSDCIDRSHRGIETLIRLGETIGRAP